MKKTLIILVITTLGVYFNSCDKNSVCVTPSTEISTSNRTISGVSSLYVSDIFKVYVNFSATEEAILIEANSNLHQLIEVDQYSENLSIKLKENTNISGKPTLNIYLTLKSLNKVSASGVVDVFLKDILKENQLNLELEGVCNFNGAIEVKSLVAELDGPCKMNISGNSNYFEITGEGASKMAGFSFTTNHLNAILDGASEVAVTVEEALEVDAQGASKVYYKGNGTIKTMNLEDASELIKIN